MNTPEDALPLDLAWPEIEAALKAHRNLVLVAEPGAGKTTRFPPLFLRSGLIPAGEKVLMLEPRRLAARASAHRIASEQGWQVGNEVGYQVRFESRIGPRTRLQILTEGLLAKKLQSDAELSGIACVILDEFHERSQHCDLALGLLHELQELSRPDLRIIVMSATLDAQSVSKYLSLDGTAAPIVTVPGRVHPVDIQHSRKQLSIDTGPGFLTTVSDAVGGLITGANPRLGDVLVFLPGAREIRGVRERIGAAASSRGFDCVELHGSLALEDQDRAIRRSPSGKPKIILATNIAETSLTIDGVGTVVDSGLARIVRLDQAGFERLQLSRISLASAKQRAGRAGRQGPGLCYRLWSKLDEASMPDFEQPELLRTDLTDSLLTLLSQNVTDPENFSWFERPPIESLRFSLRALSDLGLRDRITGALSIEGREAMKLPLSARLSRLMIEAVKARAIPLGAKLCALLSEKDIATRANELKQSAAIESDILLRLHLLMEKRADTFATRNALKVADALEQAAARLHLAETPTKKTFTTASTDELAARLLLLAYPDRVCRRRRPKEPAARMVGGRGVTLAPFSAVETSELFIAIESSEPPPHLPREARIDAQIALASFIERAWLTEHFPNNMTRKTELVFDDATLTVQKQWAESYYDLPLEEPHVSRPSSDESFAILVSAASEKWTTHFAQHEELSQVLSRLRFLDIKLPYDARTAFLEEICFNEARLTNVLAKPGLSEALLRHLPPEITRALESDAPGLLVVPSGSRIPIQYPDGRAPFLEVRIQEIFGMRSSPKVGRGKTPIVIHLLGPNFRPVQVTSDLESFWRTGYTEVRKELRTRYPKHSWPEDPTDAKPEAKGRRRT